MKQSKRIIPLILTSFMIFSLAACGGTSSTESAKTADATVTANTSNSAKIDAPYKFSLPLSEKPVTLTILNRFPDSSKAIMKDLGDSAAMKQMFKETNVTLSFIHPPAGDICCY